MKGFHKFLFDQGCPGYPFRDMLDNLTDEDILDTIEEYVQLRIKEENSKGKWCFPEEIGDHPKQ